MADATSHFCSFFWLSAYPTCISGEKKWARRCYGMVFHATLTDLLDLIGWLSLPTQVGWFQSVIPYRLILGYSVPGIAVHAIRSTNYSGSRRTNRVELNGSKDMGTCWSLFKRNASKIISGEIIFSATVGGRHSHADHFKFRGKIWKKKSGFLSRFCLLERVGIMFAVPGPRRPFLIETTKAIVRENSIWWNNR